MLKSIVDILMERDGLTRLGAEAMVTHARQEVAAGADPEELLHEEFGLEPDYIFELLDNYEFVTK